MKKSVKERGRGARARASAATLAMALLLAATAVPRGPAMGYARRVAGRAREVTREAQRLEPGKDVAREITSGATHHYELPLDAGQYVTLSLSTPTGADVALTLFDPGGLQLDESVQRSSGAALDPVSFVTESAGVYRLRLRAPEGASARSYSLSLEVRPAAPRDKTLAAAERAFRQGTALQYAPGEVEARNLRAAIDKYQQAADLWREAGDPAREAKAFGAIGDSYLSLPQVEQAVEFYLRRLKIVQDLQSADEEAEMSEDIGKLYHERLRDKDRALRHLEAALRIYRETDEQESEVGVLAAIGNVYADLGATPAEKEKSLEYLFEALALYRTLQNRYYEGDTLGDLMRALKALGRPWEAIFFGKLAINTFQEIRAGITDIERETQEQFIESKEEVYRDLADLLITEDRLWEAWQVLDMLKEEEHSGFFERSGRPRRRASPHMSRAEEKGRKEFRKTEDKLFLVARKLRELLERYESLNETDWTVADLKLRSNYERKLTQGKDEFSKYLEDLASENSKHPHIVLAAEEFKDAKALMSNLTQIGPNTVALYTLMTPEKYRVIMFAHGAPKAFESDAAPALRKKAIAFRQQTFQPHTTDYLRLAKELYQLIVGPIAQGLEEANAKTLLWSLDGMLRYVPVAALHDGNQYMVERYRNVVLPRAAMLQLLAKQRPTLKGVGFGVSLASAVSTALPWVPEELSSIFRPAASAGEGGGFFVGDVYLDDSFTEDSIGKGLRGKPQFVHIASHFYFGHTAEDSFLQLGKGRRLPLNKLVSSSYDFEGVQLLTLSACDTAIAAGRGKGILQESFAVEALRIGAHAVVATLWRVDDGGTKVFMQEFYRIRAQSPQLSKADALRCAQLSLLGGQGAEAAAAAGECPGLKPASAKGSDGGQHPAAEARARYSHPYYWAPFLLLGNPQ